MGGDGGGQGPVSKIDENSGSRGLCWYVSEKGVKDQRISRHPKHT